MTPTKPVALFAFTHPWMQEMILKAAPPEFEVRFIDRDDEQALQEQLPLADLFVTVRLPAEWVPLLKRCKLVQHQGVGYDGIDLAALAQAGIPFALTPEGTVIGVAEHTVLLILALSKQLVQVHESVRDKGQFNSMFWRPNCRFFYGKTLGIVGFGRIGRRVAHLAHAFEVTILYYDIVRAPASLEEELQATEEAQEVVEFCRRANVRIMINENFRWQVWYRKAKEVLDSNALGRVFAARLYQRSRLTLPTFEFRQAYFAEMPRLIVYELGVHYLDTLRLLAAWRAAESLKRAPPKRSRRWPWSTRVTFRRKKGALSRSPSCCPSSLSERSCSQTSEVLI